MLTRTWGRWCQGLASMGMSALATVTRGGVRETAGFDVTVMDRDARESYARYPFKLALEAVGAIFKHGREHAGQRHRTPFEVMETYAVAVVEGDQEAAAVDLAIVREWSETANDMRLRQCPWPPGMRAWFAEKAAELGVEGPLLDPELTDEEIADAEEPESETLAHVRPGDYSSTVVYELDTLRAAARSGGMAAVVAWFDVRGLTLELTSSGAALCREEAGGALARAG